MSNRLSIVVNRVTQRHCPDDPYNEIVISDDYNAFDIYLDQTEAPTSPKDLLKRVFDERGKASSEYMDLLSYHLSNSSGLEIEGDWIEWDDSRISDSILEEYIGNDIIVPDPLSKDPWNHSFTGTIKALKTDSDGTRLATIEDQDGNCWDVEFDRLKRNLD